MVDRKKMGRVSPLIFLLIVLASFFATYNFLTHYRDADSFDPMHGKPGVVIRRKPRYHVALTATDAAYSKWQCRIMYYWYKKVRDMPGSDIGGFTRILHSWKADNLMDEMPTVVVDPLLKGLDLGYIVLNRPWAFIQWLETAIIQDEYILLAEPDHIFVNPLPNLANPGHPAAFSFFYIRPAEHEKLIRKFYPEEKGPVIMLILLATLQQLLKRYAYAVASSLHGVKQILHKDFMLQPPWDLEVVKKYIIHYTYGCDYNMKLTYRKIGEWRFDKRSYLTGPPPINLPLPPPCVPESVVRLVKMVNEATANIPNWDTAE